MYVSRWADDLLVEIHGALVGELLRDGEAVRVRVAAEKNKKTKEEIVENRNKKTIRFRARG